ncbi:MAG: condensation domain-containing protein, partial [Chloroflexota bacterium]
LRATQLLAQLQAHFSIQLTQRELFAAPTIAQLADLIDQQDAPSVSTPPLGRRVYDDIIPLSFAQQRLWFLDQLEPGNAAYNIPLAISITGPLNRLALYQAMREIICRHETLRTTFQVQHGKPHQVIHKNPTVAIKIIELNRAPTTIPDAVVRSKIEEEIHHPFHLACGPLLRMFLLQTQSQVHIFVITLHHIISDGWSVGVLVQELNVLYNAFVQQLPAPLPALPIQYADFAYWQQESLYGIHLNDQQSYWVQQLHDATPYLNLPTDYPRPPVQSFEGTSCLFQMSEEFSQQLRAFSKQEGVTLFMTLLAALGIVLTRICEQDEIVVAAPIANRTHHEVTNLIGFFVNTLALRVALSGDLDGHTLLAQVHTTTLESYNHQDIPFIQVVEALKPPRDTSRSPFSQVFLTLQNVPIPEVQLKDLSVQPINLITEKTKADLSFTFLEHKEGLQLEIQYSTHLFSIGTIKRIQHQYRATLEYLVNYPEWKISHLWTQVSDTIQRTYE